MMHPTNSSIVKRANTTLLNPLVRNLLLDTIDTPTKLQLVLMFAVQPRLRATADAIRYRIYCDPWSTEAALEALRSDGIVAAEERSTGNVYCFSPTPRQVSVLALLLEQFADPYLREQIVSLVRSSVHMSVPEMTRIG